MLTTTITTRESVRAMGRDATRLLLTRTPAARIWVLALAVALLGGTLAGIAWRGGDDLLAQIALVVVAVVVLIVGLAPFVLFVAMRRSVEHGFPVGDTVTVGLTEDSLTVSDSTGSLERRYGTLGTVHVGTAAVLISHWRSGAMVILPRASFSDDDIASLQERIASALGNARNRVVSGPGNDPRGRTPGPTP